MPEENIELDIRLLQLQIAVGNQKAFSELYTRFSKRLLAFSYSLVHAHEIAEEVVEDVFVGIWGRREEIAKIDNLAVYLYVAVKNRSLNRLSEKAKNLITQPYDLLEPHIEALNDDPHSIMVTAEMVARMNRTIENLPPRCKMIFKLIREDGLRYKEVAEILNISVNTIDVQMAIAVKRISEALGIKKFDSKTLKKQNSNRSS
ncbi:MAG TPA: RNA polymerase sigma-70 factor [Niabella sp.]|nr:RNA polymerase sigma-70 factor [Chitinophagaceae bacterium]HRN46629.1 RNA polymerase sigma-70 factor [Niabella sp.]HRO84891.1 RNA polymerase sigma-70 factor [Niabella sp.]HUN01282.1 RNA polymerase sigma-70 factor [Niabella sp.]